MNHKSKYLGSLSKYQKIRNSALYHPPQAECGVICPSCRGSVKDSFRQLKYLPLGKIQLPDDLKFYYCAK